MTAEPDGIQSEPAKTGRPPVEIDPEEFQKLVTIGCTMAELAEFFSCSKKTISRRLNDPEDRKLREAWERGRSALKMSIRRLQLQYAQAKGCNGAAAVQMLIHLSKHHLGEIDKIAETNVDGTQSAAPKQYVVLLPHNGRDPLPPAEADQVEDEDEIT